MEPRKAPVVVCPHCQVENPPGSTTCGSCQKSLILTIGPVYGDDRSAPRTLHLHSVMILVATVAICLGAIRAAPGFGIVITIVTIPALLRTFLAAARRKTYGFPMSWNDKLATFLLSLGIVMVIGVGACIAFVATCLPTAFLTYSSGPGIVAAFIVGFIAAGAVVYHVGRALWPDRSL